MFRPAEVKPTTPLISTIFNQIKNKIDESDLKTCDIKAKHNDFIVNIDQKRLYIDYKFYNLRLRKFIFNIKPLFQ